MEGATIDFVNFPDYIAIIGSRTWPVLVDSEGEVTNDIEADAKETVEAFVSELHFVTTVVSGGAKGVDTWGEDAAIKCGLPPPEIFLVDRERIRVLGFKAAALERNTMIVNRIKKKDGLVVAFKYLNSKTHGTDHAINYCDKVNVPCIVFERNDYEWLSPKQNRTVTLNPRWSKLFSH